MKKMVSSSHYTIPIHVFFLGGGPIVIWGKKTPVFSGPTGWKDEHPGPGISYVARSRWKKNWLNHGLSPKYYLVNQSHGPSKYKLSDVFFELGMGQNPGT